MADNDISAWHTTTLPSSAEEGTFGTSVREELSSPDTATPLPDLPEGATLEDVKTWVMKTKEQLDFKLDSLTQQMTVIGNNLQSYVPLILKTSSGVNQIFGHSPGVVTLPNGILGGVGYTLSSMNWDFVIPLKDYLPDNAIAAVISVGNFHLTASPGQIREILVEAGDGSGGGPGRAMIVASDIKIHQSEHSDPRNNPLSNISLGGSTGGSTNGWSGIVGLSADEWKSFRIRQNCTDTAAVTYNGVEYTNWHADLSVWLHGYFVGEREYQQAQTSNVTVIYNDDATSGQIYVPNAAVDHPYNTSRGVFTT